MGVGGWVGVKVRWIGVDGYVGSVRRCVCVCGFIYICFALVCLLRSVLGYVLKQNA